MKFTTMQEVPRHELGEMAWARLRRFHNPYWVTEYLSNLHQLDKEQKANAKKQAQQIRYCLVQAKEYYDACRVATLATQPTLLYYCAMHLALAEVLTKQSGDSSLDRAREQHRHHGLDFQCDGIWRPDEKLAKSAAQLRARPLIKADDERFGTFELWHRSAREAPIGGYFKTRSGGGAETTGFRLLFDASDVRLEPVPSAGFSLLDCLTLIPGMERTIGSWGVPSKILRARIDVTEDVGARRSDIDVIIHPVDKALLDQFIANVFFFPNAVDRITILEPAAGLIIRWWEDPNNWPTFRRIPAGCMAHTREAKFWPEDQPLNQFGFLYMALFIAGNYARYYPDWWMRDIEVGSPLALAIEDLLRIARDEMPLLAFSALTRTCYVPAPS